MRILIAEDDPGVLKSLQDLLKKSHDVSTCTDGTAALGCLSKHEFDIVITDHQMPGLSGMELLEKGREISPSTSFVLMTAYGSYEQSVEAIRKGAEDYFVKPFDLAEVKHRIQRIVDLKSWNAEQDLKEEQGAGLQRLIGSSKETERARHFIQQVAPVDSPVLILGPTGSGKELVARAIHESGPRGRRPFIPINCASLSEQLMESELFGHEKGAFTGATAAKPGKFELAKGGTLFLDELGEMSIGLQAKLLRVLQEREFYRVGGVRMIKSDARIIAATNRSLKEMVKEKTFREDLFFRFNVLSYELLALSHRREDIPRLAEVFLTHCNQRFGKSLTLADETKQKLQTYSYPGNIRELQNVLERLVVLSHPKGQIAADLLPPEFHTEGAAPAFPVGIGAMGLTEAVEALEAQMISQALSQSGNNQVQAAKLLQIDRNVLRYKMKKYALDESEDKAA